MIFFNVGFMAAMAVKARINRANVNRMRRRILRQIIRISRSREVETEYLTFLSIVLTMPNALSDYDRAMEQILAEIDSGEFYLVDFDERTRVWMKLEDVVERPEETLTAKTKVRMWLRPKRAAMKPVTKAFAKHCFMKQVEASAPTITALTSAYRKKDEILHTYYAAFLRKYGYLQYACSTELVANFKDLVEDGGVFACEHVMQALYTAKDEKLVFDMLKVLDVRTRMKGKFSYDCFKSYKNIASVYNLAGRHKEAHDSYAEAAEIARTIFGEEDEQYKAMISEIEKIKL